MNTPLQPLALKETPIGEKVETGYCDLSVVVPVYCSAGCLDALVKAVREALGSSLEYELILVNDGSKDESWEVIERICRENRWVVAANLRRNFGQDNAIMTGLRLARGKAVAIMDDDLQHDPGDLPELLKTLQESAADVVFAAFLQKRHRLWKKLGSWVNGKVAEWLLDKPPNIYLSPYKILSRQLVDVLVGYEGPDAYVDGLILQATHRFAQIRVAHHNRYTGESTYTFVRSVWVWSQLAFSFSVKPLRLATWIGTVAAFLGMTGAVGVVLYRLLAPEQFTAESVGWASLMTLVLVLGGIQMLFLGLLGEFVGRTHMKVSQKPQSVVAETRGLENRETPAETANQQ